MKKSCFEKNKNNNNNYNNNNIKLYDKQYKSVMSLSFFLLFKKNYLRDFVKKILFFA